MERVGRAMRRWACMMGVSVAEQVGSDDILEY